MRDHTHDVVRVCVINCYYTNEIELMYVRDVTHTNKRSVYDMFFYPGKRDSTTNISTIIFNLSLA